MPARRESCGTFPARDAMLRPAPSAGRGWKSEVSWLAAHGGLYIYSPLKGIVLATFSSNEVWPQQSQH